MTKDDNDDFANDYDNEYADEYGYSEYHYG